MSAPHILKVTPADEAAVIRKTATTLQNGALVVIPTETVYGVAAHAGIPAAVASLFDAKGRDRDKPIPLLAVDLAAVEEYGAVLSSCERRLAERFWPGALTLVLTVGARTEGFRVPAHRLAQRLLNSVGGVLRVTSANLSGEPPARTAGEALQCLGPHVELVLDDGPVTGGSPSTVVRMEGREVRILRAGAISENEIREAAL